jgi:hypothetical protein
VELLESVEQARKRAAVGSPAPAHYRATPPLGAAADQKVAAPNVYK